MNDKELNRRFPDLLGSQAALRRAASRAQQIAEQTGTQLIIASHKPAPKQAARPLKEKR